MKYYFIVATPRSGTTFLSRAMDHAYLTKSVIGDLVLPVTCSLHSLSLRRGDTTFSDAIEQGFESEIVRRSQLNSRFEALHRLFSGQQGILTTKNMLMRKQRFERFVFKEPFLSFSPNLADTKLASGIFWIVRDGRDVANSLVTTYNVLTDDDLRTCRSNENPVRSERKVGELHIPWWVNDEHVDLFAQSSTYIRSGLMWAYTVETCKRAFEGHKAVMQERYEDIVSNPELCQRKIQEFLGAPRTPQLEKACKAASGRSIGAFQKRERSEIVRLEGAIGDTLSKFGYAV